MTKSTPTHPTGWTLELLGVRVIRRLVVTTVITISGFAGIGVAAAPPAHADDAYSNCMANQSPYVSTGQQQLWCAMVGAANDYLTGGPHIPYLRGF